MGSSWSHLPSRKRAAIRALVYAEKGTRCYVPGCTTPATTVDHITPAEHGGTHTVDNLEPCCLRHNTMRQDMPWHQWLAHITGHNAAAAPQPATSPSRPW